MNKHGPPRTPQQPLNHSPRTLFTDAPHESHESGITLLELIFSLAILGLLLPVITLWFTAILHHWHTAADRVEARQQATVLLQRLENELREARSFSVQADGLTFLNPENGLIRYRLVPQNNLLLRDEPGIGTTVLSGNVTACRFSLPDPGTTVRFQFTIQFGDATFTVAQPITGRGALP